MKTSPVLTTGMGYNISSNRHKFTKKKKPKRIDKPRARKPGIVNPDFAASYHQNNNVIPDGSSNNETDPSGTNHHCDDINSSKDSAEGDSAEGTSCTIQEEEITPEHEDEDAEIVHCKDADKCKDLDNGLGQEVNPLSDEEACHNERKMERENKAVLQLSPLSAPDCRPDVVDQVVNSENISEKTDIPAVSPQMNSINNNTKKKKATKQKPKESEKTDTKKSVKTKPTTNKRKTSTKPLKSKDAIHNELNSATEHKDDTDVMDPALLDQDPSPPKKKKSNNKSLPFKTSPRKPEASSPRVSKRTPKRNRKYYSEEETEWPVKENSCGETCDKPLEGKKKTIKKEKSVVQNKESTNDEKKELVVKQETSEKEGDAAKEVKEENMESEGTEGSPQNSIIPIVKRPPVVITCQHCGHVSHSKGANTTLRKCVVIILEGEGPMSPTRACSNGMESKIKTTILLQNQEIKKIKTGASGEAQYRCQHCTYATPTRAKLARHMRTHGIYVCLRCTFISDTHASLKDHYHREHKDRTDFKLCRKCSRYVKCTEVPLDKHMEKCLGPVAFICNLCSKEFKYESSFKSHIMRHNPDASKLFHCEKCSHKSNYKYNLKKHMAIIHGEKVKHVCCVHPGCEQMFYTEDSMQRHLKWHSWASKAAKKKNAISSEKGRKVKAEIEELPAKTGTKQAPKRSPRKKTVTSKQSPGGKKKPKAKKKNKKPVMPEDMDKTDEYSEDDYNEEEIKEKVTLDLPSKDQTVEESVDEVQSKMDEASDGVSSGIDPDFEEELKPPPAPRPPPVVDSDEADIESGPEDIDTPWRDFESTPPRSVANSENILSIADGVATPVVTGPANGDFVDSQSELTLPEVDKEYLGQYLQQFDSTVYSEEEVFCLDRLDTTTESSPQDKDRQHENHYQPNRSVSPLRPSERIPDNVYDSLNAITSYIPTPTPTSTTRETPVNRQTENIFPAVTASTSTTTTSSSSFMHFTENDALLQHQRMTTPFFTQSDPNALQNLLRHCCDNLQLCPHERSFVHAPQQ